MLSERLEKAILQSETGNNDITLQEICGGPERGECISDPENCFKCDCKKDYDGTYCENCPVSNLPALLTGCPPGPR